MNSQRYDLDGSIVYSINLHCLSDGLWGSDTHNQCQRKGLCQKLKVIVEKQRLLHRVWAPNVLLFMYTSSTCVAHVAVVMCIGPRVELRFLLS